MDYRLLALDVDGVLTDGGIYIDSDGRELLRFHVADGLGMKRWMSTGRYCVWITARESAAVFTRAKSLGVDRVLAGIENKEEALTALFHELGLGWKDVVYVGDDLVDLDPIRRSGLGVAVCSAVPEVKEAADLVTITGGGQGAVREVIDSLLG